MLFILAVMMLFNKNLMLLCLILIIKQSCHITCNMVKFRVTSSIIATFCTPSAACFVCIKNELIEVGVTCCPSVLVPVCGCDGVIMDNKKSYAPLSTTVCWEGVCLAAATP